MLTSIWPQVFLAATSLLAVVIKLVKDRDRMKAIEAKLDAFTSVVSDVRIDPHCTVNKKLDDIAGTLYELLKDDKRVRYVPCLWHPEVSSYYD